MNKFRNLSQRFPLYGALATLIISGLFGTAPPAYAHEAKCPYCKMDVVQDTATLDNEVTLKYGRKRIEYRCVYCAISQARSQYKGDVTILAPAEVKGKPVTITRTNGQWAASPSTAVFSAKRVNHRFCQTGYRAFSNKAGFEAFARKNANVLKGATPVSLSQMVAIAK